MSEFMIGDLTYRVQPFDADVHISVLLKLLPTFSAIAKTMPRWKPVADDIKSGVLLNGGSIVEVMGKLGDAVMPISEALAELDRKGIATDIIDACLGVAEQKTPDGRWHRVRSPSGVIPNDANKAYMTKLHITWNVVRQNFAEQLARMGVDMSAFIGESAA